MSTSVGCQVLLIGAVATAAGCVEEAELAGPYGEAFGEAGEPEASQVCAPEFGRSFVIERMELMDFGQGYDLTGDGEPDNALAFLGLAANDGWRTSIEKGRTIYLFDLLPYLDSLSEMPEQPRLVFYNGEDADDDPANNVTGEGEFLVPDEQFDIECSATSEFDEVSFDGAQIDARTSLFSFFMEDFGTLEFSDWRMALDVSDDMTALHGTGGGIWSYCSLSRSPFPGPTPGTFLDVMINGFQRDADIDRDGDGLEVVVGDGDFVTSCIDGDGTEILGPSCVCDPRIVDGYSVAMEGWGVPAQIVGLVDSSQ